MSTSACLPRPPRPDAREPEDAALLEAVRAIQAGDPNRFEEIYTICFARVQAVTRSLLRDDAAAEDALQEAFLSAYRSLPRYRPQAGVPFIAWLLRIARNAALMRVRAGARVTPVAQEVLGELVDQCSSAPAPDALDELGLRAALASIPSRQREVLLLRFSLDLSTADTAAVMGTTDDGVRQLQRRALTSVRRVLARPEPLVAGASL